MAGPNKKKAPARAICVCFPSGEADGVRIGECMKPGRNGARHTSTSDDMHITVGPVCPPQHLFFFIYRFLFL